MLEMSRVKSMDRYGYVSNNYHAHAMGGGGRGGCANCQHYHHHQKHMPATQALHKNGPVTVQPMPQDYKEAAKQMMFAKDGREWTTGLCGCFEHCASCKSSTFLHGATEKYVTFYI